MTFVDEMTLKLISEYRDVDNDGEAHLTLVKAYPLNYNQLTRHFSRLITAADELGEPVSLQFVIDFENGRVWLSNGYNRVGDVYKIRLDPEEPVDG